MARKAGEKRGRSRFRMPPVRNRVPTPIFSHTHAWSSPAPDGGRTPPKPTKTAVNQCTNDELPLRPGPAMFSMLINFAMFLLEC